MYTLYQGAKMHFSPLDPEDYLLTHTHFAKRSEQLNSFFGDREKTNLLLKRGWTGSWPLREKKSSAKTKGNEQKGTFPFGLFIITLQVSKYV